MKRFLVAAVIVLFFSCVGCGSEQPAENVKNGTVPTQSSQNDKKEPAPSAGATVRTSPAKYDIKAGIVYFDVTDISGERKEIVYFDDYGRKECTERFDAEGVFLETRFCDGKQLYNFNSEKTVVYIVSANAGSGTEMRFDKNGFSARQKEKYNYQDKPDLTIAGKTCESFYMETGSGKTVFAGWSHITLYHNQETRYGNILRMATRIEENISVPQNKFEVPAGYDVQKAF